MSIKLNDPIMKNIRGYLSTYGEIDELNKQYEKGMITIHEYLKTVVNAFDACIENGDQ